MQTFINKKVLVNSNSIKQYVIEILLRVFVTQISTKRDNLFLFVLKIISIIIIK